MRLIVSSWFFRLEARIQSQFISGLGTRRSFLPFAPWKNKTKDITGSFVGCVLRGGLDRKRLKQLIHLAFAVGKRIEMDADFVEQRKVEIG